MGRRPGPARRSARARRDPLPGRFAAWGLADAHAHPAIAAAHTGAPGRSATATAAVLAAWARDGIALVRLGRMAARGIGWTPTLCAAVAIADDPEVPAGRRTLANEALERFRELVPMAVRMGVPVLAGTDVVGTVAREVALLAGLGLDPRDALAAATVVPRTILGHGREVADIVTYDPDPRHDPELLGRPAAVVVGSVRLRQGPWPVRAG